MDNEINMDDALNDEETMRQYIALINMNQDQLMREILDSCACPDVDKISKNTTFKRFEDRRFEDMIELPTKSTNTDDDEI